MDTTIRNLDEETYRRLRANAALRGLTVGEAITEAMRAYLERGGIARKRRSFADLPTEDFGKGSERASEEVDATLYGS